MKRAQSGKMQPKRQILVKNSESFEVTLQTPVNQISHKSVLSSTLQNKTQSFTQKALDT